MRPCQIFRHLNANRSRFLSVFFLLLFFTYEAHPVDLSKEKDKGRCSQLLYDRGSSGAIQDPSYKWTPQLDTIHGRVELLMSIMQRHPHFVTANLNFKRNVLDTFSQIPEVRKALGENAQSLEIQPPQVLSVKYFAQKVQYDESRLSSFRRDRENDLMTLRLIPSGNITQQLRALKDDMNSIKTLFRVLPFLFDSSGNARFTNWDDRAKATIAETIRKSTPSDFENAYFDFLREHIEPQIEDLIRERGMDKIRQVYQNFRQQFVEKGVRGLIRPTQSGSSEQNAQRVLSIESLPASVSVARGCYGGDCSILSVPYYPLLRGVTVHFIRKSKDIDTQPDGYVLSVKVRVESGKETQVLPYFLTVNGARLSEADVRVAIALVKQSDPDYATSSQVAFPDWSQKPNLSLVNWYHSHRAMRLEKGQAKRVSLPQGWRKLVEYHNLNNQTGYTNYYGDSSIVTAMVGEFSPRVQFNGAIENTRLRQPGYLKPSRVVDMSPLERAIVAGQALQDSTDGNRSTQSQLFQVLQVSEGEVRAALPLLQVSPSQGLTLAQYRDLERQFGFGLRNVLAFEVKTRANVLANLYEESPDLFIEHRARENTKVRDTLLSHYGGESYRAIIESIWNNRDISDSGLVRFLNASPQTLGSHKIEDYVQHFRTLNEASNLSHVRDVLAWAYLASGHNDATLARGLSQMFQSTDPLVQSFRDAVMKQAINHGSYQVRYPILSVYLEVFNRAKSGGQLEDVFKGWIQDQYVSPSKKADFVMTLIGSGETIFNRYFKEIKNSELPEFWSRIAQRTSFKPYYELARQKNLTAFVLQYATLETFLYTSEGMPKPGHPVTFKMGEGGRVRTVTLTRPIQVAVAPETDILWELLMENNPSKFSGPPSSTSNGVSSVRNLVGRIGVGETNGMNSSNRPVENITWWSAAEYLNRKSRLEGLEPVFDFSRVTWTEGRAEEGTLKGRGDVTININANGYRFATEAEQEYFIRAGTKTTFPTGEDEARLQLVAWFIKNSEDKTHPIGQLRPNAFGLVDTSGNVWEWGLDWYGDLSNEATQDPMGPSSGSERVTRGGCWSNSAQVLRSAFRHFVVPGGRVGVVGLRSVKKAK